MLRIVLTVLALLLPAATLAQQEPARPAVLVADELFITSDRELVARGNVEAFQGGTRLEAREIRYNRESGALTITGPIRIYDGQSGVILADAADLDSTLRIGLLTGARLVLDQQLQLAAASIERVSPRYDQLYKTAVTSCRVCEDGKPPLWQIRARRVIHDKEEGQLYFDQAQFRIRNTPVFYIPRLRLPDPTVERADGFLIPTVRTTSELGVGIKLPYFFTLGDDRDITVTPYIASRTTTLELRYRQAFVNGSIELNGAVSRDDERPGETRAYLFGTGAFDLRNDFKLDFDFELTTDDSYLRDYDYSDKDRLDSEIVISRARRDEFISGGLINFKSLRDGEDNSTLPTIVADAIYEKRYFPSAIGGELRLGANGHTHIRSSDQDIVGRDVSRINLDAEWLRGWTLPGGLRAEASLGVLADLFNITQDSTTNQSQSQVTPFAAVALRYPLAKTTSTGVTHFLEPMAQLGWTGGNELDLPNEESTLVEFDGGNLLSLSRFPSVDRRERGRVTALGVNWSRFDPAGLETTLTLGQLFRSEENDSFTVSSGLEGKQSDFLVAGQLKTQNGWSITGRSIFNSSFDFTKAEIRGQYDTEKIGLTGTYLWLTSDTAESRPRDTSEISLDGWFRIDDNWSANADWRYDTAQNRASTVGVGFGYNNECVSIDFSVKRRYTTSTSLEPSTSLGFTIGLRGFSAKKGTDTYARTCG